MVTTLVVNERGAGWPVGLPYMDRQLYAISQNRGEELAGLVARVTKDLDRLTMCGVEIQRAYLACSGQMNEAALGARVMIASAILRMMSRAGGGELVLAGDLSLDPALRPLVSGLAEALARTVSDPRIAVRPSFNLFHLR